MSIQKKSIFGTKDESLRRKVVRSSSSLKYYGPPPIEQPTISSDIGYRCKKRPEGLKKKMKKVQFGMWRDDDTNFRRQGSNILKRLRQLNYLSEWVSKKSVYNLYEQKFIRKFYQSSVNLRNTYGAQ